MLPLFVSEAVKVLRLQLSAVKQVDYAHLQKVLMSLTQGESDKIALMATVVGEVHHSDDRFDWTGFYRVTEAELLKVGPYQGGHGCLVIPFARGVGGAAGGGTCLDGFVGQTGGGGGIYIFIGKSHVTIGFKIIGIKRRSIQRITFFF